MVTIDLPKELDELIDLKQFKVGQIIEHTEVPQAWQIVDVRKEWLKVQPLFKRYIGDKRKHERFHRVLVDTAIREGWWRIGSNE